MSGHQEKIRVLFLSDHLGYANGIVHGATVYFLNVLPQLRGENVELTVCFLRERHAAAQRLEKMGIRPIFLNRHKWDPRALHDLLKIIDEQRIQIVHAAGMKGILLGRIAARLRGCRAVIHLHDTSVPGVILGSVQRMLARWSDLALVVSKAVGELAVGEFRIPRHRVQTLYNPVDVNRFARASSDARNDVRRRQGIQHNAPVIGIVGRLSEEKGHELLIGAMPELLHTCPGAMLLIVGDGVRRSACEELVDRLNLRSSVRFTGHCSNVAEMFAAVDVVVVPSSREGLGYTALEAMAAKRPVVAFAVGGLVELIRDGETGLLAPPGDAQALVEAIQRVLADSALARRLAERGNRQVRGLTIGSHVTELKARYQTLLRAPVPLGAVGS